MRNWLGLRAQSDVRCPPCSGIGRIWDREAMRAPVCLACYGTGLMPIPTTELEQ
jgi:hypothetical protein